jgi:hypothetical protein
MGSPHRRFRLLSLLPDYVGVLHEPAAPSQARATLRPVLV